MSDDRDRFSGLHWVRMAAGYHFNPKIRAAGHWASCVHFFLICQSRLHRLEGRIPERYLEPAFIADGLGLFLDPDLQPRAVEVAAQGLQRAFEKNLLDRDPDGGAVIHDWGDWQTNLTDAAIRMRKLREERKREREERQLQLAPPTPPERETRETKETKRNERGSSHDLNKSSRVRTPPERAVASDGGEDIDGTGVSGDEQDANNRSHRSNSANKPNGQLVSELAAKAGALYEKNIGHPMKSGKGLREIMSDLAQFVLSKGVPDSMVVDRSLNLWLNYLWDPDPFLVSRDHGPQFLVLHDRMEKYWGLRS